MGEISGCARVLAPLIAVGDLHAARTAAVAYCIRPPYMSNSWVSAASTFDKSCGSDCADAWREQVDALLVQSPDALAKIALAHDAHAAKFAPSPEPLLRDYLLQSQSWEACCTRLSTAMSKDCGASTPSSPQCAISSGSVASLQLPLLLEPSVALRLHDGKRILQIDQDGFLRPFDMATVVWPAGFLLSLWSSDRDAQHRLHLIGSGADPVCSSGLKVLDLGSGTGAAALAAAASLGEGASVMATDRANQSLALVTANAALNELRNVRVAPLDYESDVDVASFSEAHGPYDLILGGALMTFVTTPRIWPVLRSLTSGSMARGGSVVALAHTVGTIPTPPEGSGFHELERISGLEYGFHTRWASDESDFEIVVLQRISLPSD